MPAQFAFVSPGHVVDHLNATRVARVRELGKDDGVHANRANVRDTVPAECPNQAMQKACRQSGGEQCGLCGHKLGEPLNLWNVWEPQIRHTLAAPADDEPIVHIPGVQFFL